MQSQFTPHSKVNRQELINIEEKEKEQHPPENFFWIDPFLFFCATSQLLQEMKYFLCFISLYLCGICQMKQSISIMVLFL